MRAVISLLLGGWSPDNALSAGRAGQGALVAVVRAKVRAQLLRQLMEREPSHRRMMAPLAVPDLGHRCSKGTQKVRRGCPPCHFGLCRKEQRHDKGSRAVLAASGGG